MTGWVMLGGLLTGGLVCGLSERLARPPAAAAPNGRWLTPAVAAVCAVAAGWLWTQHGPTWEALRLAAGLVFLLVIALIDARVHRVPNLLVYPALGLTLLWQALASPATLGEALAGGGLAFGLFALTAWLRPGQLGGGDIKLAAVLGVGFGFPGVLWALLVGAGVGGIVAGALIALRRWSAKQRIAYAPFLCLGAAVALVFNPLPLILP